MYFFEDADDVSLSYVTATIEVSKLSTFFEES